MQQFDRLIDFNIASIHWLKKQLSISFQEIVTESYHKEYNGAIDIRGFCKPGIEQKSSKEELYYQIFADRNGFLPNLSVLDLLFSEGSGAIDWIIKNKDSIKAWRES